MDYFEFLKSGNLISVIAPSMGCSKDSSRYTRICNAEKILNKKKLTITFSNSCFNNIYARSGNAKTRAKEFEDFYFNDDIKALFAITGGEFELEILPFLNLKKIKSAKNKIFQGMSDNTCLSFVLATVCDKASIYGYNFAKFGMDKWHKSIKDNFNFLCGKNIAQLSFNKVEDKNFKRSIENELDGFKLDVNSCPKILSKHKNINISGRIIGGNLDILSHICGTKFDNVKNFIKKYESDGIIWFFESCDLNILEQSRCFWKLKNAGWFNNAKGFLIGRPYNTDSMYNCNYKISNYENLKDFNVPVVIDLDIGHIDPTWFIVNGSFAHFKMENKKAKIEFEFK